MHNLKNLKIWSKSIDLAVEVYEVTKNFPFEERYGITSQIIKAAVSVSSNIAEGAGRNSDNEFNHFLGIANGSLYELQTQLEISYRVKYLSETQLKLVLSMIDELEKMIYGFQNKLRPK